MHISHVETPKSIIEGLIKLFLVCARFDCEMPLKGKVYLWRRMFFFWGGKENAWTKNLAGRFSWGNMFFFWKGPEIFLEFCSKT